MAQTSWQVPAGTEASPVAAARSGTGLLSNLTPRSARELFSTLQAPDVRDLSGRWDGHMVGRRWLRSLSTALALPTPLRGWCGKEITPSGHVTNRVRRRRETRPSVACTASLGMSVVDGCPVVVADYSKSGPPPVAWLRGEIRTLVPHEEVLGLLMLRLGHRVLVTMPFHMVRSK
jgi:hypothetical protein